MLFCAGVRCCLQAAKSLLTFFFGITEPVRDVELGSGPAVLGLGGELAHPCGDGRSHVATGAPGGAWSVAGELGDGFLCADIVDEILAVGGRGDERGDSGVVPGIGQPAGDAVEPGGGVAGEHAQPQLPVEGGLSAEERGERRRGIHVGVRQLPEVFELRGVEEAGLVDDDHDAAVPFGGRGGQQVTGLAHHLGLEVAGPVTECADDGNIQPSGAEGGFGDLDDLVAGGSGPATAARSAAETASFFQPVTGNAHEPSTHQH